MQKSRREGFYKNACGKGGSGFLRPLRNGHLQVLKQISDTIKIHSCMINSGRDAEEGAEKLFSGQILETMLMKF